MGGGRDLGIDLSWCLALFGLLVWTWSDLWPLTIATWVFEGPPVMLAAVLTGAGAALAVRRRGDDRDWGGVLRATMARGLLLAVIGLVLGTVAFEQWGFLAPLGLAVALAAGALLLPAWAVAVLAAAAVLFGSLLVAESTAVLRRLDVVPSLTTLVTDPGGTWTDVILTGANPVATLVPGVLAGMVAERLVPMGTAPRQGLMGMQRLRLGLLALGGALLAATGIAGHALVTAWYSGALDALLSPAALTWLWRVWESLVPLSVEDQIVLAPGTGSVFELARTIGLALAVLGIVSLLATELRGHARLWAGIPRALGAAAISLYAVGAVAATAAASLPAAWTEGVSGILVQVTPWLLVLLILASTVSQRRATLEAVVDELAERAAGGRQPLRLRPELPDERSFEYEVRMRAPIERVWQAMTEPSQMLLWAEIPDHPILEAQAEPGLGGTLRWRSATLFGSRTAVIEFPRVEPPSTLVSTIRTEGGPVQVTSVDRLFEFDGVTTVRTRNSYATERERDRALRMLELTTMAQRRLVDLVEHSGTASGTMVG